MLCLSVKAFNKTQTLTISFQCQSVRTSLMPMVHPQHKDCFTNHTSPGDLAWLGRSHNVLWYELFKMPGTRNSRLRVQIVNKLFYILVISISLVCPRLIYICDQLKYYFIDQIEFFHFNKNNISFNFLKYFSILRTF